MYLLKETNKLLSIEECKNHLLAFSFSNTFTCTAATSKSFSYIQKVGVVMGVVHIFPTSQPPCYNFRTTPLVIWYEMLQYLQYVLGLVCLPHLPTSTWFVLECACFTFHISVESGVSDILYPVVFYLNICVFLRCT